MLKTLIYISLFFFAGCTTQYTFQLAHKTLREAKLEDVHQLHRNEQWVLPRNAAIGVLPVKAMLSAPRATGNLGLSALLQIRAGFPAAQSFPSPASVLSEDLNAARDRGIEYLIQPVLVAIKNQRDSVLELSDGDVVAPDTSVGRDKTWVQLYVYETHSDTLLDVVEVRSSASFFKDDDKQAMDLFEGALALAVSSLSNSSAPR